MFEARNLKSSIDIIDRHMYKMLYKTRDLNFSQQSIFSGLWRCILWSNFLPIFQRKVRHL